MKIRCVWEHNGDDSLIYSDNFIGAFARGQTKDIALGKMAGEVRAYLRWRDGSEPESLETEVVQEKISELNIFDADSDVLFEAEKGPLDLAEYEGSKALALRSAKDLLALYGSIPDKNRSCLPNRQTFYGPVPRTAFEMYEHTKNVNRYYFGEIGVEADNEGSVLSCRARGFDLLEAHPGFLDNCVFAGSYGEEWSLRKLLRRFIWHDRIHAKAMYKMAVKTFGADAVPNVFQFVI